jgi:hypothetical protein
MSIFISIAIIAVFAADSMAATSIGGFSPLSTFYDIDVSTSASFYTGKSFGPGCARGGQIPDGFIAVAMNGLSLGMKSPAAICGMCVAIKGPAPTTADPVDNTGVCGEYYGYVYEVCEDCSQASGLQLGISGKGQSNVVWRAIPCPTKQPVSIFFDGCKANRARFQVRGLSAPIVSCTIDGQELSVDKAFFVHQNISGSTFPLNLAVITALGEQLAITVPAFREYGDLSDLITVRKDAPARTTSAQAPTASSEFGSGKLETRSGSQTRMVATSNQAGRQVLTITNSPDSQASIPSQRQHVNTAAPQQGAKNRNSLYADSMAQTGGNLAYINNDNDRKRIETFLNSPNFAPKSVGAGNSPDNGVNQFQAPLLAAGQYAAPMLF